jgi:hypothetical protein
MRAFLTKRFVAFGLDTVEYCRYPNCGFVSSKTHAEMAPAAWEKLNFDAHASYQGTASAPNDDPLWIPRLHNQASIISDALDLSLLMKNGRWLDYACGDGKLCEILSQNHDLQFLKYERYMVKQKGYLTDADLRRGGYDFVITTSVFEHLVHREDFDFVASLVSKNGVLGLHTLVCESVPEDPMWFYLSPVHCSFHTNRSMDILLTQWGYTCSIYSVEAKLWLWFKDDPRFIEAAIRRANDRADRPHYIYKKGFVDYWKGSSIRRSFPETGTAAD